jgi:transposase
LVGVANVYRKNLDARVIRFAISSRGGVAPFKRPARRSAFDGLDDWLRERFFRHDGNADVIRQELASEHGIIIGLRSVELRVRQWRRELKAQKRAAVRFETAPGHQMQIDFGDTKVWIGDERVRIHLFVGTLGYSRRMHARASLRERQPRKTTTP